MFRVRISGRGPKGQWWPPSRPAHINNPTAQVRTISVFRILCASCLASCVFHICHPTNINNPRAQVRSISVFRILCASCLASCVFHICYPTNINNPRAQVRTISVFRFLCFVWHPIYLLFSRQLVNLFFVFFTFPGWHLILNLQTFCQLRTVFQISTAFVSCNLCVAAIALSPH